jgi:3-deoxy-D-manno-octulosonic-acid transferase
MLTAYDIAWHSLLAGLAPACGLVPKLRRKVAKALRERSGNDIPVAPHDAAHCVIIHAVSLGEMNATRALVAQLKVARPDLRFLVTVTTDTGYARGQELYGNNPRVTLARYPLDLSTFVRRLLDNQRPVAVVLMELEVWPNFVLLCERRGIPVILVNGRLTESSFRTYRLGGTVVRRMFRRLSDVCVQDAAYAERFKVLGARPESVQVTGTMKFDTADAGDRVPGDAELATEVGLLPGKEPIWICGSTGPSEEQIVLGVYRQLLATTPSLRLVLVPRHPERFDAVADLIRAHGFPLVRRSSTKSRPFDASRDHADATQKSPPVVLGDTMGELRKFYSLADVVFVGRSLVDLGQRQRGSDMIEPAALAKPVIIGPWTQNFFDVVRQLKAAEAIIEVTTADELRDAVWRVLAGAETAATMSRRAQAVVRSQQGATARHVEVILKKVKA